MTLLHRPLVAALVLTILFVGSPVSADDRDASDPPRTSGPLVGHSLPCEDNGPVERNEARAQSCSWSYDLLPAETDPGEDFSAYWVQMEIDPGNGWCAKEIRFELDAPSDGRIVSAVPAQGGRISESRGTTTELVVDAGGAAPVPGRVAQDVTTARGRISVTVDPKHYSYLWSGNSRDKVVVAIGVQLSHGRLPPDLIYSWSEGQGFAMGSCRPMVVRVRSR